MMNLSSMNPAFTSEPDPIATRATRRCYQRLASVYDAMEGLAERRYQSWRKELWALVRGPRVLEAGVGTGKNMPFYPPDVSITAIDLTPGMLQRARKRAATLGIESRVDLRLGDVQELEFSNASFDSAVAAFVFCSVPDPVPGLRELKRMVKHGGRVLLLEHVRSPRSWLGALMDFLNPVVVRMMGANINRKTVENVQLAGLEIEQVEDLGAGGIFKLIAARAPVG